MKRFLLFSFDDYYPNGGWNDFVDSFDTVEEAASEPRRRDGWHVVDSTTGEIVAKG